MASKKTLLGTDIVEYACGCGTLHSVKRGCDKCDARPKDMAPRIMGHPAEVALTLVDFEDSQGRCLRDHLA